MYIPNDQPKLITYRDYKKFYNKHFLEASQSELNKLGMPLKNKNFVWANHANFMDA